MKPARILRFHLPADWPRAGASCGWALLAPDGRLIQRGASDARHWPEADTHQAILAADQVSLLSAKLPRKLGRDGDRIVGYALEDKLIEPPEAMHLVVCRSGGEGEVSAVIAINRVRLQEIVDAFTAVGRPLDGVFTELQLAPVAGGQWLLCHSGKSAFLLIGRNRGLAVDWIDATPPDVLAVAIDQARARGALPKELRVAASPEQAVAAGAWSSVLGIPVVRTGEFDPLGADVTVATNLLTGPYARSAATRFPRLLRAAVMILLLAGVAHTVLSLADWIRLSQRAGALREEATAIYRAASPGGGPILDPGLQLQREAGAVLRERGRVGPGDMITMLALLAGELPPGTKLRSIRFELPVLEVTATLPSGAVATLGEGLWLRGYAVRIGATADGRGADHTIRMQP